MSGARSRHGRRRPSVSGGRFGPGMGVDFDSVLMDLNNQPEFRHQRRLALLLIQGWALTLRVAAAAIVTFNSKHTWSRQGASRPPTPASARSWARAGSGWCILLCVFRRSQQSSWFFPLFWFLPCMSESRLPWLETTLWTLLGLSLPQPDEETQVHFILHQHKRP